ncbi:parvalbumin alpha-like isoform X2 [Pseudophryne corroboree]
MKKVFQMLDQGQDGFIEEDAVALIMKGFSHEGRSLTEKEIKDVLADGDKNGDGKISLDAPASFNPKKYFELLGLNRKSKDDKIQVFHMLDQNASGFLEEDDLGLIMKGFSPEGTSLTEKEIKDILADGDKKGDGKISLDEFITMVSES